jgi:hypothetical protein
VDGRFRKSVWVFACAALFFGGADASAGLRDAEFSRLPFEQWLAEGDRAGMAGWTAEILPAEISTHQRLMLRVVIRVEGRVLEKRRGSGEFVTLVEYRDSNKEVWQNHTSLDLTKLQPGPEGRQLAIAQYAFVLPGDYSLAIAVCDTATLEHSVIFRGVHAEALASDPLPNAWSGLPAVEFIPAITEPPDVWYLPGIEHRLNLAAPTRRPVHIQLLVNTTPSARAAGSLEAMRANMSATIPALKAISQIDVPNGSVDVAFLDLTRRRVSFEQTNVRGLDWDRIREIFREAKPGVIDARDLAGQAKMQAFFRDEVVRRLGGGAQDGEAGVPVVIVLSGPAFLVDQERSDAADPGRDHDRRLFYIRFVSGPGVVRSSRKRPVVPVPVAVDGLEQAVESIDGRLFEATSVEEFRRILAELIDEISRI